MNDLLPPNATPQERAITIAARSTLPLPIRSLWNPSTCPAHLLPWLAWSLSVDNWDSNWSESRKRAVIQKAVDIARHKGTRYAVEQSISNLGGTADIVEWWQTTPKGEPHTFEVNIVGNSASLAMQDAMTREIRRTKPLRSHFTVNFGQEAAGTVNVVGILRPAVFLRLEAPTYLPSENYTDQSGEAFTDAAGEPYYRLI